MTPLPTLITDAEVSRNLRRHLLTVPGEGTTFAFVTVEKALESCLSHGFDEFILHAGQDDYLCKPAQRSLLDALPDDAELTKVPEV